MPNNSKWTGERLDTTIYSINTIEHLHRYALAINYVLNKEVLDIACGSGYGCNLLSSKAKRVVGIDIDENTIVQAKSNFNRRNIEFIVGTVTSIPVQDHSFDIVISFETIEHVNDHEEMLNEIKRVLKPDGVLIISSPDKLFYSDIPNFRNKFHIKELYENEFKELIKQHFDNVSFAFQRAGFYSLLIPEKNKFNFSAFTGDFSKLEKTENWGPIYWIAVASNFSSEKNFAPGIFDGNYVLNIMIKNYLYNSKAYKLGKLLISPLKFILKLFSYNKI